MGTARAVFLGALLLAGPAPDDVVALAARVSGTVTARPTQGQPRPVRTLDWLPQGAAVEAGPDGEILIVYGAGARFRVGPTGTVTLGRDGLRASTGPVETLAPVSPLPRATRLARGQDVGDRAGAVRVRGSGIGGLYPHEGARVLADQVVLRFKPRVLDTGYRIRVESDGETVFEARVQAPPVPLPPAALRAGGRYRWWVTNAGESASGEGVIVVLPAEEARARAAVAASLEAGQTPAGLALLAEVDRGLGLLWESRQALQAALSLSPDDEGLRQALVDVEAQIAHAP